MLAFAFAAPISALIHLCGRKPEKNRGCGQKDRSVQQALYCDLQGEGTMIDLGKYLADCLPGAKELLHASKSLFEQRVQWTGGTR